ncbi:hypothetical protein [Cupriavidus sp. SS-3]|nr:hypothetical protein [Cupriavidus sp. SS-3]MEC3768805.1 hypothetical protein [Cupriavidus sp. SS-3]
MTESKRLNLIRQVDLLTRRLFLSAIEEQQTGRVRRPDGVFPTL